MHWKMKRAPRRWGAQPVQQAAVFVARPGAYADAGSCEEAGASLGPVLPLPLLPAAMIDLAGRARPNSIIATPIRASLDS
mmetsp:Transcript_61493/g.84643  ORF Transcript_61493/g.84643 Transcript_61493/m.84643 type:complete len:80 (-) Transcript_61493:1066-1305(-)